MSNQYKFDIAGRLMYPNEILRVFAQNCGFEKPLDIKEYLPLIDRRYGDLLLLRITGDGLRSRESVAESLGKNRDWVRRAEGEAIKQLLRFSQVKEQIEKLVESTEI